MNLQLTRKMIESWCEPRIFGLAEQAVAAGKVLRADFIPPRIEGEFMSDHGGSRHLALKLNSLNPARLPLNECSCMDSRNGGVCVHAAALAIAIMLRQTDPERQRRYAEEQRRAQRLAEVSDDVYIQRSPQGRKARLELTLDLDTLSFELRFDVDGVYCSPEDVTFPIALSHFDDNLLGVLEDICEGPPSETFTVTLPDLINILELSEHGAIESHAVVLKPPRSALYADLEADTFNLFVTVETKLPQPLRYFVSGRKGFVLSGRTFYKLAQVLPAPYHAMYDAPVIIPRRDTLSFLRKEFTQLCKDYDLQIDSLTADAFTAVPKEPKFAATITGSQVSLKVELAANYSGSTYTACALTGDFCEPDPEDPYVFRVRSFAAEKAALRQLVRYGITGEQGDQLEPIIGARNVLNFLGSAIPEMRRNGWHVTVNGPLQDVYNDARTIVPVVKIEEEKDGWFDVSYTFETDRNTAIPVTEVQRALQKGESFVCHDGNTYLLDTRAVQSMRSVFEDCPTRTRGAAPGHFQLPKVYAPFVQSSIAALEGIDVEDPPDWRERAAQQNRNERLMPVPLGALEDTLRPYQKEGVYWLRFLESGGFCGLLADEMGLGKTLQTLTWISLQRINTDAQNAPALIVCPTSLVENWNREAEKFVPHLKRLVISGARREECFGLIPEADLVITSYALLRRDIEAYLAHRFAVAVLDEAQHIKNRSTQNAVAAKQLSASNKLVLSGTPVENSVADLWSIMDFLMPGYLGDYESFKLHYEQPIASGANEAAEAQLKLRRKLNPFLLRRLKKEVAKDLPDKIRKVSYCRMSPDQERVYNKLLAESKQQIGDLVKEKGFNAARLQILAVLMKLRQTCCHLSLLKGHRPKPGEQPSAKLEQFLELLDETIDNGSRMLVFSQFTSMLAILRDELNARNIRHCYLDGSTKDRLGICSTFNQDPGIPVFLISLKAGGTGLNLTGADTVVHFDPWWNPAVEDQATDRAHRIGQKKKVYAIKLITEHTVEEKVLALQQRKQKVIDATVGSTDHQVMEALSWDDVREIIGI